MIELVVLDAEQCRPLRTEALGDSDGVDYPGDDAREALHLGLRDADDLIGIASVVPDRREGDKEMWRLRGVVVRTDRRSHGLGRQLVNAIQTIVAERGGGLWCSADGEARAFLEHLGLAADASGSLTWSG